MIKSLSSRLYRTLSLDVRNLDHKDPSGRPNDCLDHDDHRPSHSLVPLPVHIIDRSIKSRLPLVKYSTFLEKKARGVELGGPAEDHVCVVCMDSLDGNDQVREQPNCRHVCHGECLDAWIGQDHAECPLCRAYLMPSDDNERDIPHGADNDPWRAERMDYLFGEDCRF